MNNFIETGDIIAVPAPSTVASGDGVLVGSLFGVAVNDAATGAMVEVKTTGVFHMPKLSAQAWTVGQPVYWDNTAKLTTTVSTANTLVGKALEVAGNPSGVGTVRLDG